MHHVVAPAADAPEMTLPITEAIGLFTETGREVYRRKWGHREVDMEVIVPIGSLDTEPTARNTACQYDSCPANSGPVGRDANSPRLNWVKSFPVTSMRYGIDAFGPQLWNGEAPELAVWSQLPLNKTTSTSTHT
jgi:hypothetical protein